MPIPERLRNKVCIKVGEFAAGIGISTRVEVRVECPGDVAVSHSKIPRRLGAEDFRGLFIGGSVESIGEGSISGSFGTVRSGETVFGEVVVFFDVGEPGMPVLGSLVVAVVGSIVVGEIETPWVSGVIFFVELNGDVEMRSTVFVVFLGDADVTRTVGSEERFEEVKCIDLSHVATRVCERKLFGLEAESGWHDGCDP